MRTINIERSYPNIPALDETLRNHLADQYVGLSAHGNNVSVHLADNASSETVQQVQQWVQAHDPSELTSKQAKKQARENNLVQLRSENDDDLVLSVYEGSPSEVQLLARKIAWLEQEIRALRGL